MVDRLRYFCLQVIAPHEIQLSEHLTVLEEGFNIFNVSVKNIEVLKEHLTSQGCTIKSCNALDEFEPVGLESVLTEQELKALNLDQNFKHATLLTTGDKDGEDTP